MIRRGQHVDRVEILGDRQRADELRAVDEDDRTGRTRDRADGPDVGSVAGRGLHRAERHQRRAAVDPFGNVGGLQTAVAERDLADVVALAREQSPREVIRAVLAFADHDVLPVFGPAELGRHQTGRTRHRRDQGDIGPVGADQRGDCSSSALARKFATGVVETRGGPLVDVVVIGVNQRATRQAHRRRIEVRRVGRGREKTAGLPNVGRPGVG